MGNDIASLLALLTGGAGPIDPRAQFMAEAFTKGALPGNQISNMNTILDLLSPSASMDFAERTGGPERLGAATGLPSPEIEQVIRQAFGLQLGPAQEQAGQLQLMQILPLLQEQETKRGELGVKQREAGAKEKEAEAKMLEAGVKQREVGVAEEAEKRMREQFEKGTIQDQVAMVDANLKAIAMTGKDLTGNDFGPQGQQNAYLVLRGLQANPGIAPLVAELAKQGKWSVAAAIAGVPEGALKEGLFGFGVGLGDTSKLQTPGVQPLTPQVPGGAAAAPGAVPGALPPGVDPQAAEAFKQWMAQATAAVDKMLKAQGK